jgi:hypothetical protein
MKPARLRILWLAVVITPLLMGSRCSSPPFTGGIRTFAFEAPLESPGNQIGVGGVFDTGEWIYWNVDAQHSKGTQYTFSGTSDYNGYDNHPNAADNSVWQVGFDFTLATGGVCLIKSGTGNIPSGGCQVDGACLLPPD